MTRALRNDPAWPTMIMASLTMVLPIAAARADPPGTGYSASPVFSDEFNDSTIDRTKWYFRDVERDINNITAYQRPENVTEISGFLRLKYAQENVDADPALEYTGGGVISRKLLGYGYYETRARLYTTTTGLHTSFWSMGLRSTAYTRDSLLAQDIADDLVPNHNQIFELDGFEHDSPNEIDFGTVKQAVNAIFLRSGDKSGSDLGVDLGEWVVYGYDLAPDTIRYYVNGVLRFTINRSSHPWFFNPMNVWLTALPYQGGVTLVTEGSSDFDYVRFWSKSYPGTNRLGNPSFDVVPTSGLDSNLPPSWIESYTDTASKLTMSGPYNGGYALIQTSTLPYLVTTKQNLQYLPNGTYKLTARVRSSGGQADAKMRVLNYGAAERIAPIAAAATWTQITIDNIVVTNGAATVAFTSDAGANQWIMVDDVVFSQK